MTLGKSPRNPALMYRESRLCGTGTKPYFVVRASFANRQIVAITFCNECSKSGCNFLQLTENDIDGSTLLDMIKDTSEFSTVLHKSAHCLQVKRAVKDVIDNPEVGSKQQKLVPVGFANFFQKFLVMTFKC